VVIGVALAGVTGAFFFEQEASDRVIETARSAQASRLDLMAVAV
jgi:hypothetical protein